MPTFWKKTDPLQDRAKKLDREIAELESKIARLSADKASGNPASELEVIQNRFTQLMDLGCTDFALLFDDIPAAMQGSNREGFQALAQSQARVANAVLAWLKIESPQAGLLFCPTEYCTAMAWPSLAESKYLVTLGLELDQQIPVLWTGGSIISEHINPESIAEPSAILRRKLVLWDNLYANDYDSRRLYLGPYLGRPASLKEHVAGILINPNCQFEANYLPLHSFGLYVRSPEAPSRERHSSLAEMWLPLMNPDPTELLEATDLELLVDCFYLPFEDGARVQSFLRHLSTLASGIEDGVAVSEVISFCEDIRMLVERLSRIRNRDLMLAIYRQLWDLREETFYIEQRIRKKGIQDASVPGYGEFHPRLFRGGLVSQIQAILPHAPHGPS